MTLEQMWEMFRDMVFPDGMTPEQSVICRDVFFGGVVAAVAELGVYNTVKFRAWQSEIDAHAIEMARRPR